MKQLFPRGKRIRPTDKDLVFYTALASLLPVFLLVVLLFHIGQIAGTNWQEVSLSQIVQDVNIPYLLFSMGVAGLVCLTAVLLFWRYRRDEVKQLIHRQKLARMVLENKWYESEQRKEDAFFKDLSSSRSKETITYFPKIYYRMKQGLLHIRVEITLGKYQEQLLNLERKLESGLYCELTDKELKDSYVEYTLHWLSHQVAPTLKLALRLDKMNHTQIVHDIITHARLTEKHEKILKQQAAAAKEVVL
ncbi:hypothetical protein [Faecalibacillus faecis]|uniref:hypothetical protein n=1 Tax=Faecalibacillus faecis TaxID=1982628 RepID=UPI003D73CAB7